MSLHAIQSTLHLNIPCRLGETKSKVAGKWVDWLHDACHLGGSRTSKQGTKSAVARNWADQLHIPCRLRSLQCFRAGGENQKWSTSGRIGCKTPSVVGVSYTSRTGTKTGWAHKWADWLGQPQTWPTSGQTGYLPPTISESPTLQRGQQNQKCPTSGHFGYITPTVLGVPCASKRGQPAHLWATAEFVPRLKHDRPPQAARVMQPMRPLASHY